MTITNKDYIKITLTLIFLIIAAIVYWAGRSHPTTLAPGFKKIGNSTSRADELITNWQSLPVIHGEIKEDFWDREVIVSFVFDMTDCAVCLPRMHEYISFTDSLVNNYNIGLLCVGFSNPSILLERYIRVSPKPCPVLRENDISKKELHYRYTPKVIIIDKRKNISIVERLINSTSLSRRFLNKYMKMILEGW